MHFVATPDFRLTADRPHLEPARRSKRERLRAKVTVIAKDTAGERTTQRRTIRLTR